MPIAVVTKQTKSTLGKARTNLRGKRILISLSKYAGNRLKYILDDIPADQALQLDDTSRQAQTR